MFRELVVRRIGAYVGVLSIVYSGFSMAMKSECGNLRIYGKNGVDIKGSAKTVPVKAPVNVSEISYEDFDVTARLPELPMGGRVFGSTERKMRAMHLDTNIPCVGMDYQHVDYASLQIVPYFIVKYLTDKAPSSVCTGAKDFFESVIARNHENLDQSMQEIPDLDCLYYKEVGVVPHLFLRLSSRTRKKAETFKQESAGKTVFVENGDVIILSDGKVQLDHVNMKANNIEIVSEKILNRASKMNAKWIIRLVADEQRHETVINKWVKDEGNSEKGSHTEGISGVDDCSFIAQKVIQSGEKADNIGIFVEADTFEDRAHQTTNMPAKITLYNRAWEEKNGLFSSARTEVKRTDDVLVPTRYHVNYYSSPNSEAGSSVKFGYTLIDAGSKIEVLKDVKEDVVVDEKHTIEIHEEKSGFSILGGVSVPDPTVMMQKLSHACSSGNMVGLTTSAINAVAKGIQICNDCKQVGDLLGKKWTLDSTKSLLMVLSHFVNGPSIQFGHRSVDIKQSTVTSHGNTVSAPKQVYHNKERSTFAGDYIGEDISIKTKTFVTLDLPQTTDYEMSVHQSGISMDLLSFALALTCTENVKALEAALGSSAISVSCQSSEMHQEVHKPTRIHASERLDIEAENGELTQTQIKAGIVHAVFTDNLVLKTLANEKWSKQSGGSASFGFGDLAGMLKSATISNIDAGSFEKIIDDFASMVGEKEFYLKVGNILRSESAFVGHMNHDPKHEYKSAKITQIEKVKQGRNTWNNNFDFSAGGLMTVIGALGNSDRNESVEQNISDEDTFVEEDFIDREYGNEVRNDVKDSVKSDIKDKVKDSAKNSVKIEVSSDVNNNNPSAPFTPSCPERDQPSRIPVQNSVRNSPSRKRRGSTTSNNSLLDPNAIDWKSLPENAKIDSKIINWNLVRTEEQVGKIDMSKVHIGLQDNIPLRVADLMLLHTKKNAPKPPVTVDRVTFAVVDSIKDKVVTTAEVAKYVTCNPKEALQKTCSGVKEFVMEGVEGFELAVKHTDLLKSVICDYCEDFKNNPIERSLDIAEYCPVIGTGIEAGRDAYNVITRKQDLRRTIDKWVDYGIVGVALKSVGGKMVSRSVGELGKTVEKKMISDRTMEFAGTVISSMVTDKV